MLGTGLDICRISLLTPNCQTESAHFSQEHYMAFKSGTLLSTSNFSFVGPCGLFSSPSLGRIAGEEYIRTSESQRQDDMSKCKGVRK